MSDEEINRQIGAAVEEKFRDLTLHVAAFLREMVEERHRLTKLVEQLTGYLRDAGH